MITCASIQSIGQIQAGLGPGIVRKMCDGVPVGSIVKDPIQKNLWMRATAQRGIYESLRSLFFVFSFCIFNHSLK